MRIGIDVDGVLADHLGGFLREYRERTGITLAPEDLHTWDVRLPRSDDTLKRLVDDRLAEETFLAQLDPIPDAPAGMRRLARDDHELVIVTHRPPDTHPTTKAWLDEHDIPYDDFVHDVPEQKGTLPLDVLVDDYHRTIADAPDSVTALLLLQPWNRRYAAIVPPARRLPSWPRICSVVDA